MDLFRCVRCGTTYAPEFVNDFGSHAESDGYGNNPVCTALVDDKTAPTPMADKIPQPDQIAQKVCRGSLVAETVDASDEKAQRMLVPSPITKNLRYR